MIASENIVSAGPLMAPPRCAGWGAHGAIRARVPKNGRNFALGRPFLTCSPNPETALRAGRLGPISCAFSAPPSAPENSIVSGLRFVGFVKPRDGRCFFPLFLLRFWSFFFFIFLFIISLPFSANSCASAEIDRPRPCESFISFRKITTIISDNDSNIGDARHRRDADFLISFQ